ncbi:polyphosphate kinase 1 [bacterium]|nr:polyphosphate kinase 1 [bacterium]
MANKNNGDPAEKTVHITIGADPIEYDPAGKTDLNDPRVLLNREHTWLNFNRRVLYEAENPRNPLLERIKFLSIVSSNTDEFFMKRIGGLKQLIQANVMKPSVDGLPPREQIDRAYTMIRKIEEDKSAIYTRLAADLERRGVMILEYKDLRSEEVDMLREEFTHNIFPLIIPQGVGPAHPFPFISNLSLNLLVTIQHRDHGELSLARVKVPVGSDVPRLIRLYEGDRFIRVEDVILNNLDVLFPGVNIVDTELFRVTRNANTEKDEETADDLLELIESEIRDRRFAPIVRLQVEKDIDPTHLRMLVRELELTEEDIFSIDAMVGKRDLMELTQLDLPTLKYKPHYPIDPPRLKESKNLFDTLYSEGPILLYHPYESFSNSVERFLRESARDPNVRAIKMTLYRTSSKSKVIQYLTEAAQNGKQVAVVIELKARFDEAANIQWASRLEEVGVHVTYGVVGYKTHAKMIMAIRKEFDGFRIYAHVGTGNYHGITARLYTDLGMLTCDEAVAHDLTELFNFLTSGYTPTRRYKKLLMAPSNMKAQLLAKIDREIRHHEKGEPACIRMKMNALEDADITRALYRASQAGVKSELSVRDTCRLRPGVEGLSDNIRVVSIIGRFLEHARIYSFHNAGDPEIFIGSADAMRRNLEHRVEILTPVEDETLKKEVIKILDVDMNPRYSHWVMQPDGSYVRVTHRGNRATMHGQNVLMNIASKRAREADKPRKVLSKGKSEKEHWAGHDR